MNKILMVTIFLALASSGGCGNVYSRKDFPKGFSFGAGASAYQWEGAVDEDGRKPSVWDTFVHSHGRGPVNPKGLQFYKNFIELLVNHGIQPHVTLYHYDHPQYLENEYGGWLNRKSIEDFTAYADVCFREFGNHVKFWTTINEANIYTIGGYSDGLLPPGHCSSRSKCSSGNSSTEPYIVGHNLLLAHASASRLYKQKYKGLLLLQAPRMMRSQFKELKLSYSDGESDTKGSKKLFFLKSKTNRPRMLGPLTYGDYPDEMKRIVGSRLPVFTEEESALVKGSSDFVGVIHYLAASVTSVTHVKSQRDPGFFTDMGISMKGRNCL
uniref:Sinigrinase n=1 Tax=Brassica oleracea var. oleracea TaxID=109376 RepID=A0A0D3DAV7_BRAOL